MSSIVNELSKEIKENAHLNSFKINFVSTVRCGGRLTDGFKALLVNGFIRFFTFSPGFAPLSRTPISTRRRTLSSIMWRMDLEEEAHFLLIRNCLKASHTWLAFCKHLLACKTHIRRASALNRVEDLEYFWVFLGICSLPEVFIYGLLDV